MTVYISGSIFWVAAWAVINPAAPGKQTLCAAFLGWLGLVFWELAMVEYRKRCGCKIIPSQCDRCGAWK